MLIIPLKGLHGFRPDYLRNCLLPVLSSHPIWFSRMDMLWVPSAQECWLGGDQELCLFSGIVPPLWNNLTSEIRIAPTLLTFCKTLKTWLCAQARVMFVLSVLIMLRYRDDNFLGCCIYLIFVSVVPVIGF